MKKPDGVPEEGPPVPDSLSLKGIPPHVARCLAVAIDAARGPAPTLFGTSAAERAARVTAGDVIQASRVVQAWAESVEARGTRMVLRSVEEDCGVDLGQHEPGSTREARRREARRATAAELEILTGLSATMCRDRVALASATDGRAGYLRIRMEQGTLDAYRAIALCQETRHLDALTADSIARSVLKPLDGEASTVTDPGSLDAELAVVARQLPVSQGTFRRRLKRQLTKAESAAGLTARKAAERQAARDVRTGDGPYGTATTWIEAMRDRAYAAQHRIDAIARSARQAGDERTLAQLRSDIATDLLIHGTVAGDHVLGSPPAARLNVYVNLATLLPDPGDAGDPGTGEVVRSGTDNATAARFDSDGLGEVPGLGFLTGDQVRRLALTAGSVWRRLVTDPTTGTVMEACRTYRPTRAMRELVMARDHTCRAPGCEIAARDTDLDHNVPWRPDALTPAEGATHPDNLHALHRGHHHAKTRRWWHSTQGAGGVVHWRTLTGQTITSRPPGEEVVRSGADNPPPAMVTAVARILDDEFDPPPMLGSELAALHIASTSAPPGDEASPDTDAGDGPGPTE